MEDYVTYEQAVKLKELGFDWECLYHYKYDELCGNTQNFEDEEDTLMNIEFISKASAASFKINIVRKVLNKDYNISFTEGKIYYPRNYLLTEDNFYAKRNNEVEIALVKINNENYTLLGGDADTGTLTGLGYFNSLNGIAANTPSIGYLGCATKEIAQHFGRYFAKEIFEAKYGDLINYERI